MKHALNVHPDLSIQGEKNCLLICLNAYFGRETKYVASKSDFFERCADKGNKHVMCSSNKKKDVLSVSDVAVVWYGTPPTKMKLSLIMSYCKNFKRSYGNANFQIRQSLLDCANNNEW
jgi:hypothetical protein